MNTTFVLLMILALVYWAGPQDNDDLAALGEEGGDSNRAGNQSDG